MASFCIGTVDYLGYFCVYIITGKGNVAHNVHIGAKHIVRIKYMVKYANLKFVSNVGMVHADESASSQRFHYLTTLHAKLFLFLLWFDRAV